jgi:hypothetical protein
MLASDEALGSDESERRMVEVLSAVLIRGWPLWKQLAPRRSPKGVHFD